MAKHSIVGIIFLMLVTTAVGNSSELLKMISEPALKKNKGSTSGYEIPVTSDFTIMSSVLISIAAQFSDPKNGVTDEELLGLLANEKVHIRFTAAKCLRLRHGELFDSFRIPHFVSHDSEKRIRAIDDLRSKLQRNRTPK